MPFSSILAFTFLAASILSLWLKREPKIWGSLLALSLSCGLLAGHISFLGLLFITLLFCLWMLYLAKKSALLFLIIVALSIALKMHLLPGYSPWFFTQKFAMGLEHPLIGLFPLAFVVPLAATTRDWKEVFRGLAFGCAGIALIAGLALISGVVQWQVKIPPFLEIRMLSNFVFTCIPEEGFYRGFVQKTLGDYWREWRLGRLFALAATSTLFALAHWFWSPSPGILAFTFIAGILYGAVYWISGKVESAILCHFLLNLIHMIFFSYHSL